MLILWIVLAVAYVTAFAILGLTTLSKGHTLLFWFGILLPVLWVAGALMAPTANASAAVGVR
jgi:hypothetical protein